MLAIPGQGRNTNSLHDSVASADLRLSLQISAHIACHSGINDVSLNYLKELPGKIPYQTCSFLV